MENPAPVYIKNDNKMHKVKVFMSPDHSIQPLAEFVQSAQQSIDLYLPVLHSWNYGENKPRLPPEWIKEQNPLFQALANVGVKKIPTRVITTGPQQLFIPTLCDMWEWLLLQNAEVRFLDPEKVIIGGTMIILDGGEKILITSMDNSPASFIYKRESSIVMETKCEDVAKLFTDTFDADFQISLPFLPLKETITNNSAPLIDPASLALIQATVFKITDIDQPPPPLLESPLKPFVSDIMEADDVEYVIAMAGPERVEEEIVSAINSYSYCQVGIHSLANKAIADVIFQSFKNTSSTSINLSYTVETQEEANASDENLAELYRNGMNYRLYRGPLYDEKPPTKLYFTHNGQATINSGADGGTLYFMTGSFSKEDLNVRRNFYIGFKSPTLAKMMTKVFAGDQLGATLWSPSAKTAVGPEPEYKPE